MSRLSYKDARPWSRAIREKVVTREMPPWHADRRYGIFRNDPSLSQKEIDTIVAWVDGGVPKGTDADMPTGPEFSDGWAAAVDPDFILELPVEYQIPADGETDLLNWYSAIPFKEDFFFNAIEMGLATGRSCTIPVRSLWICRMARRSLTVLRTTSTANG